MKCPQRDGDTIIMIHIASQIEAVMFLNEIVGNISDRLAIEDSLSPLKGIGDPLLTLP